MNKKGELFEEGGKTIFYLVAITIAFIAAGILYPFFGVLLSPIIAAGAMSASSISVLLNALRLKKIRF